MEVACLRMFFRTHFALSPWQCTVCQQYTLSSMRSSHPRSSSFSSYECIHTCVHVLMHSPLLSHSLFSRSPFFHEQAAKRSASVALGCPPPRTSRSCCFSVCSSSSVMRRAGIASPSGSSCSSPGCSPSCILKCARPSGPWTRTSVSCSRKDRFACA